MPRKQMDNPETLEDESLLDEPETDTLVSGSDALPVEVSALSDTEHAGYSLALRGLESLRLTTFCTQEAGFLRAFIDKLESLFGKP